MGLALQSYRKMKTSRHLKQRPLLRGVLIQTVENRYTSFCLYRGSRCSLEIFNKKKFVISIINTVVDTGKKVNRGGGYGLEIPCEYEFEGDNFSCNCFKDKMQYEKYDIID